MKRFSALALALLLALSLFAGCDKGESIPLASLMYVNNENLNSKIDSMLTPDLDPSSDTNDTHLDIIGGSTGSTDINVSTDVIPSFGTGTVIDNTISFTTGTTIDNYFLNQWSDISITVPTRWTIYSDSELGELMGIYTDELDDNLAEIIELGNVYDFMAIDESTGSSIIVMYENLSITGGGKSYSESDYVDLLISQLKATGQYDSTYFSTFNTTLCGYDYHAFTTRTPAGIYQNYYVRALDNYMIVCILTSSSDHNISILENYFD